MLSKVEVKNYPTYIREFKVKMAAILNFTLYMTFKLHNNSKNDLYAHK